MPKNEVTVEGIAALRKKLEAMNPSELAEWKRNLSAESAAYERSPMGIFNRLVIEPISWRMYLLRRFIFGKKP